jgi:SAM-dependent methyltransferase
MAATFGCRVTGIDLTEEFVAVARELTRRCGLAERVRFEPGDALAMPFADASFDGATLIHVGMNIADKATLFAEARRVLRPGGRFLCLEFSRPVADALRRANSIPSCRPPRAGSPASCGFSPDAPPARGGPASASPAPCSGSARWPSSSARCWPPAPTSSGSSSPTTWVT